MSALAEQALDDAAEGRGGLRIAEESIRVDAVLRQPVERQVEPAVARILAHVTRDVGELHGDPQVTGARDGIRIAHLHDERHHGAHGAGNAHRIGVKLIEGLVAAAAGIPGEALDQRLGDFARDGKARGDIREGAVGRLLSGWPR